MPRATTKEDLLVSANEQFNKMFSMIENLSMEDQIATFNFDDRDRNIRDVLIHLYEWHQLLLNWATNNLNGNTVKFLKEPYNWKTTKEMNIDFWNDHQDTDYEKSKEMIKESHKEVMKLIETFSNEQLFKRQVYSWTGTSTLGSYCVSATASHYDWAMKKIKNHIKTLK